MAVDAGVLIHGATPNYVCGTIDRIFIVRWVGEVTRAAMSDVFTCMVTARRQLGVPLVTVSIVPDDLEGPPHTSTPTTESHFQIVDRLSDALYAVFEGDRLQRRILRGLVALRALTMRIEVLPCATAGEAMERAARHVNRDPDELIVIARDAGLIA
jgi:hypothetical protein